MPDATPSFRTERADFFFRIRSCECVGLRREKSLFALCRVPEPCGFQGAVFVSMLGKLYPFNIFRDHSNYSLNNH